MKRHIEIIKIEKPNTISKVKSLYLIIFILLISSCVTGITMDEIKTLHKGMSPMDFKSQVKMPPTKSFVIEYERLKYAVDIFPMQTGTTTQTQLIYNSFTKMSTTQTIIVPVYDDFYFLYNDNGLLFWGFMVDYQKSDDELIQKIGSEILSEHNKHKSK